MSKKETVSKKTTQRASNKTEKIEEKNGQKPIVIKETEEDVVLGVGFSSDPDDFKNEIKKEAERNAFVKRFLIPLFFFLAIGGLVGFATWYYSNQGKEVAPATEEKIQTPPVIDEKSESTTTAPTVTTPTPAPVVATPTTEKKETTYTVKEGDLMSTIANANGMTSAELAAYNGIADPNSLQIGQVLKIPAK